MSRLTLSAVLLAVGLPSLAVATTADDICPPIANPCRVTTKMQVTPNSILDFGTRDLRLENKGTIEASDAALSIMANDVILEAGTGIRVPSGSISIVAKGHIDVLKSGNSTARIDVSADQPGVIDLDALGDVTIKGVVDAGSSAPGESGGTVFVTGTNVSIDGEIDVHGGGVEFGGLANIEAFDNLVLAESALVDASAGNGGDVELDAGNLLKSSGRLDIKGTGGGGFGGTLVLLTGTGDIELLPGSRIFLQGADGGDGGGDGGDLDVVSGRSIVIGGQIKIHGAGTEASGGRASFEAIVDITQNNLIEAQRGGAQGSGGSVELTAEQNLQLGSIDVFGGAQGSGGNVLATAWCSLTLPAGRALDATGPDGNNMLRSGSSMTIAGRMRAGLLNQLEYLTVPPAVTSPGTDLSPALVQVNNPTLVPCGGPRVETCGNGLTDDGEECDDGNQDACDECTPSCKLVGTCGDGRVECDEACDDGNKNPCDGCASDCTRKEGVCGDGVTECGEEHDDGNLKDCDDTSSSCTIERCGNGIAECAEDCDAGPNNGVSGSGCDAQCKFAPTENCGDGIVDSDEECDDGNTNDCDECSRLCRQVGCGNGTIEANCGEECDDLGTNDCDGCSPTCKIEQCGNGVVECLETCDKGAANGQPGSACLPDVCHNGPICSTGSTEPCIPCGDQLDCDPLGACGQTACIAGVCTAVTPPTCNDGNACTDDFCDPASGCATRPHVCEDDGNACNGASTCDPAQGCVTSPVVACDDGDICTDDGCTDGADGAVCESIEKIGAALVSCRLGVIEGIVGQAGDGIAAPARKKLGKLLRKIRGKLTAAQSGRPKAAARALRAATKQTGQLQRTVTKLAGRKIQAPYDGMLRDAIGETASALSRLGV